LNDISFQPVGVGRGVGTGEAYNVGFTDASNEEKKG
jgi:hypothetical protein